MKFKFIVAIVLLSSACLPAQQFSAKPNWDSLRFLLGKWVGEGGGDAGQGTGSFLFEPDLQGRVLVRRNHAEYPASKERPAYVHDDLMVLFIDSATGRIRATFYDNEGHVINYGVELSEDGRKVVFLSDPATGVPRYRLIYVRTEPDRLKISFEVASPSKPDEFRKFIEATARKMEDSK